MCGLTVGLADDPRVLDRSLPALKEFSASHAARYPDADSPSPESHRGLLLPLHCAFQTRKQVDEWSCSVADKFSRVDFLINFVDDDEGERRANGTGSHEAADGSDDSESSSVAGSSSEYLISSAYVLKWWLPARS